MLGCVPGVHSGRYAKRYARGIHRTAGIVAAVGTNTVKRSYRGAIQVWPEYARIWAELHHDHGAELHHDHGAVGLRHYLSACRLKRRSGRLWRAPWHTCRRCLHVTPHVVHADTWRYARSATCRGPVLCPGHAVPWVWLLHLPVASRRRLGFAPVLSSLSHSLWGYRAQG